MKKFSFLPLIVFCLQVFAQNKDAIKYASVINSNDLRKHLNIIAGEEMQGRETGTEGQRKAAAYIEEQFKKIGLKTPEGMKGYQQFYPLFQDSMISCKLTTGKDELVFGADYIIPANTNDKGKFNSNEIIFAGYGIEDSAYNDYAGIDVKGKTVIFILGEPKQDGKFFIAPNNKSSEWTYSGFAKKLDLAAKKGAVGALVLNPNWITFNPRNIEGSKKTAMYFPRGVETRTFNYAIISHGAAKKIIGPAADSLSVQIRRFRPFQKDDLVTIPSNTTLEYDEHRTVIKASNVLGIIEGTDKKDEYVYLTAHYDHLGVRDGKIYYGADDDGSGTVSVIHMAEAFMKAKAAGKGPRRTIVFMAFSGEEKGLLGSEYYSDHPVFPLEKTSVDLNIDMIGRIDTERNTDDTLNYIYVVGHDKLSSDLPIISEGENKKYTGLVFDYKFDDPKDPHRIYYRSDHFNFARKGVPVLFFYDGMLKADYHKPTDTIDKINWELFEKRSKMIFHITWKIANRDEMLKRDIPLPESATQR